MAATLNKTALSLRNVIASIFKPKYAELPVQKWFYNLVTNGTFDTDTSGWSASGATLAVVSNELEVTRVSDSSDAGYQIVSGLTIGKTYTISVDMKKGTFNAYFRLEKSFNGTDIFTSNVETSTSMVTHTYTWVATATSVSLACLVSGGNGTAYFDNISVREAMEIPSSATNIKVYENGLNLMQDAEYRDGYTLADDGFKKTITLDSTAAPETDEVLVEYYEKL